MAINLQVGADVNQATAELNKLSAAVASFGGGVQKFTPVITNFASQLSRVTPAVQKITPAVGLSVNALGKLQNSSNQAGQALSNLGRVAQDAPFGFIGIQNNLNPLLESFQRLRASSGSNAAALKALGGSLLGAGGLGFALSAASSLLLVFGDSLFSSKVSAEQGAEALKKYADAIELIGDGLKTVRNDFDFLNQLGSINVKIGGFGDLQDLREQSVAQSELTGNIIAARSKLVDKIIEIDADEKLEGEKRTEAQDNAAKALKEVDAQLVASTQAQRLIYRRIQLQKIEDQKEANSKAKEAGDKFVNDTIAQAKKLSDFTKDIISLKLDIGFFDKLPQQFAKSLQFLNKFNAGQFKLIVPIVPVLDTALPEAKQAVNNFAEFFQEEIKKATGTLKLDDGTVTDFGLLNAIENGKLREKLVAAFARFGQSLPPIDFSLNPGDFQKKMADALEAVTKKFEIASIAAKAASGAFSTAFDALVNGDNAVQALGQALQQLVLEFIKAAIAGLILKAVTNLILPGAGSVGSGAAAGLIGSLSGFRAAGGPVGAGGSYVVGEKGPELFVPRTSGTIISNNDLKSGTGMAAGFSGGGAIVLTPVLRGDQIRLQQSRTARRQNRTV